MRVVATPAAIPGTGPNAPAVNPRIARGLLPGEPAGMTYLDPAQALHSVTKLGCVRLGWVDHLAPWNDWMEGKEPTTTPFAGETTLLHILHGTGVADASISTEDGVPLQGVEQQILHLRELDDFVVGHRESGKHEQADEFTRDFCAAARVLADSLPTFYKAANGIAVNLDGEYSPAIQRVGQSLVSRLTHLSEQLAAIGITPQNFVQLAQIFDPYQWHRSATYTEDAATGKPRPLTYRTSPLLCGDDPDKKAGTAPTLLNFLAEHGRLIRSDENGHGAVFELPLTGDFWTTDDTFTRAEFAAVLRILGWAVNTRHTQVTKTLRTKDGKVVMDPQGMVCDTRTHSLPFLNISIDFSAGPIVPA